MSIARKLLIGSSGGSKKVYSDDVFSTYVYTGTSANQAVNNGIDLAGEGGLVWTKSRTATYDHWLFDTARSKDFPLRSNLNNAATDVGDTYFNSFNNNGFTVGSNASTNYAGMDFVSWAFRQAKGFFDVVTFTTGTNSNHRISHNLGCVPGMIIMKNTGEAEDWLAYHTSLGRDKYFRFNTTETVHTSTNFWGTSDPTSTDFGFNENAWSPNGKPFVAYVFAGGQSPIDYSTYFDGNGDYLSMDSSSDLQLDGDFTIECWFYPQDTGNDRQTILGANTAWGAGFVELQINNATAGTNTISLWDYNSDSGAPIAKSVGLQLNEGKVLREQWNHIAVVRKSNNIRIYLNGMLSNYTNQNNSATIDFGLNGTNIGKNISGHYVNGKISNLRVVKGQALYESNFVVPTSPLTTTSQAATESNVKLLCCNTSTNTGSTVTPGTITANGNVAANSDNPFMDEKSKLFGEEGDQNMIACGKYTGLSSDWNWVMLGWAPQWVLIKRTNGVSGWQLFDTMRGIRTGGNDYYLNPNSSMAEVTSQNRLRIEPFGFRLDENDGDTSTDGGEFIYIAIRSNDGLVSTPAEAGTEVFAMDTGNAAGTITPAFDSGFPVDFGFYKTVASTVDWISGQRWMGSKYLKLNAADAETTTSDMIWDVNTGWQSWSGGTGVQAWMWKRGAGFDTVNYRGNEIDGRSIHHSLGRTPEMIWLKSRSDSYDWVCYSKFLNGGVTPEQWAVKLGYDSQEQQKDWFNNQAPIATEFYIDNSLTTNKTASEFVAMLFASVKGISQCGTYDGSASEITITFDNGGFSPRYVIIKRISGGDGDWVTLDTLRGWGTTGPVNDCTLYLNKNNAQYCSTYDWGAPTATGMRLGGGSGYTNDAGSKYIYYAHA